MIYKFKIGDIVKLSEDVHMIPGGTLARGTVGVIHNAVHSRLGLYAVRFSSQVIVSVHQTQMELSVHAPEQKVDSIKQYKFVNTPYGDGDYVKLADHQHAMFAARQEMYRLGKTHAAELQRLRDRIAQLEEQKRQAVIALGFEDPDKVGI